LPKTAVVKPFLMLDTCYKLAEVDFPTLIEVMGSVPGQQHSSVLADWRRSSGHLAAGLRVGRGRDGGRITRQ
jgi:hypothetical protein